MVLHSKYIKDRKIAEFDLQTTCMHCELPKYMTHQTTAGTLFQQGGNWEFAKILQKWGPGTFWFDKGELRSFCLFSWGTGGVRTVFVSPLPAMQTEKIKWI